MCYTILMRFRFLAVVIQVENISSQKTEVGLKNAIRQLPSVSLNDLYAKRFEDILQMDPVTQQIAFHTFSILLCTQEPLSPGAVLSATTTKDLKLDVEALIDICSDLILVDSNLDVLRFAHLSVQEFLETKREFRTSLNHQRIARICLNVCSECSSDSALLEPKTSFYHYGLLYWMWHCEILYHDLDGALYGQELEAFLFEGLDAGIHFLVWSEEIQRYAELLPRSHAMLRDLTAVCSETSSPIFTICLIGSPELLKRLSSGNGFDYNKKNFLGATALYLASAKGHTETVKCLLELGANPNIKGGWFDYPLHAACVNGHGNVTTLLLDHGADPSCNGKFSSAFEACAFGGQKAIAMTLLDSWSILSQNQYDMVMEQAAYAGFSECIDKVLNKHGSQLGYLGSKQHRLIEQAIFRGHIGLLDRILSKSKPDDLPEAGVYVAALAGRDDMVCYLVDKGLEQKQNSTLGTPLRVASLMGHVSTVRILIERGVDINFTGKVGNALEASAIEGHPSVTKLLLQHGIDVNIRGGLLGNALQTAAYNGHGEVFELLLAAGADVFGQGKFTDAFHAAAEGSHENLIGVLSDLGYRFQIEPPKRFYQQSFAKTKHYAWTFRDASPSRAGRQTKKNVESDNTEAKNTQAGLLSAQDIACEVKSKGQTHEHKSPNGEQFMRRSRNYALELLAVRGDECSVRRMLERRIAMRIPELKLQLAVSGAARKGHLNIVFAFCELVPEAIETFRLAVVNAAYYGHLDVVKFLLLFNRRQYAQKSEMSEGTRNAPASQDDQGATTFATADQNRLQNSFYQLEVSDQVIQEACRASIGGNRTAVLEYVLNLLHTEHIDDMLRGAFSSPALTQAAESGSSQIVKLLLHQYAHLFNASTIVGAASAASLKGHLEPVKLIREKFSDLFNPTIIMATLLPAVEQDQVDISQYLLKLLPEETQLSVVFELYILAAGNCYVNVLRLLRNNMLSLKDKASILSQACNVAAQNGHASIVKYLLEEGAEICESVTQVPNFRQKAKPWACQHPPKPCTALQAALWGWDDQLDYSTGWKRGWNGQFNCWKRGDQRLREDSIAELVRGGADVNEPALDGNTPLHFAIRNLSADVVNTMIQRGADVKVISPEGESSLLAAASRSPILKQVMSLLLEAGAVIPPSQIAGPHPLLAKILTEFFSEEKSFRLSGTPLRDILTDGAYCGVKILLGKMPQEPAKDKRYGLLLYMAAASADVEFVKLLIQHGVNLGATGYYYGSALQAAARIGHLEPAEILLNAGTHVNFIGGRHETAVRAAVTGEHFQLLELLVKQGADINLKADNASTLILQLAIQRRNRDIFQYLLQNGVDVQNTSCEGESCLISACAVKEVEMAAKLIVKGADVNTAVRLEATSTVFKFAVTPLLFACFIGLTELVQLLIDNGAKINDKTENSDTPLQIAAVHGHWHIVQLLLQSGASFYPAVFVEAARSGEISVVQGLLSEGLVDLDLLPIALEAACLGQQLESIELLFEELTGTEFEERAFYGAEMAACKVHNDGVLQLLLGFDPCPSANVLSAAIAAGLTGSVEILIKKGADPNKADGHGNFPLHVAAYYQRLSIVNTLLDKGADPNIKSSKYGDTIRSVLEGYLAYHILRLHRPHPMKDVASQLPQHSIYTVLDWTEEIETLPKPLKTSNSEDVDYEGMTAEDIDRCSKLIQTLIVHFACPDSSTGLFGNHLHLAAYLGIGDWVQKFVRMGMDVNENCGYFETPLLAALLGDQISIAGFLIDSGVNVNHTSEQHGTALYIACSKSGTFSGERMKDVVSSLLHHGAQLNSSRREYNPLNAVLEASGKFAFGGPTSPDLIVEMLLSRFPNLQITGENLVKAVERDTRYDDKKSYTELFFEHDQLVQVPEAAILAGLSSYLQYEGIKLLLGRYQNGTVSEEMLKTAPSISALSLLLQHPHVCQISPTLTQNELSKKDGLQRLAMFLNHDAELRFDETVVSAASNIISADPSPVNSHAFRKVWLRYKSQDDEEATGSLEQFGVSLHVISILNASS